MKRESSDARTNSKSELIGKERSPNPDALCPAKGPTRLTPFKDKQQPRFKQRRILPESLQKLEKSIAQLCSDICDETMPTGRRHRKQQSFVASPLKTYPVQVKRTQTRKPSKIDASASTH